jgi:hypothetical protein
MLNPSHSEFILKGTIKLGTTELSIAVLKELLKLVKAVNRF